MVVIHSDYTLEHIHFKRELEQMYTNYNIHPDNFNTMKVNDIIPYYMTARNKVIEELKKMNKYLDNSHFTEILYENQYRSKDTIYISPIEYFLHSIICALEELINGDPEAVWKVLKENEYF